MVKLAKFEQVLHYIINKCGNLQNVGKTVIWKILYFSDFDFYELYEKHLTGEEYYKLPMGPAPKNFDKAISELKDKRKIKETKIKCGDYLQIKYTSLKEPELSLLDAIEIKEIDKVIRKLSSMNAAQISEYSHKDMPWKSAKDKEQLDYEMVFYRDDLMSVREYPQCQNQ
jgi:uncharacterized phage-associated protein